MPSLRRAVCVLFVISAAPAVGAQTTGSCTPGVAQAWLDVNDVRAAVFNTGALFFGNTTTNGDGYLVPQATGHSPIYASALWLGGQVGGEIRTAGGRYSDFDFWPGPLDPATALPPNPADCSAYDRIWTVSRADVVAYRQTGTATPDLAEWPAHLGAPVIDGDGVPGNYNLAGGDQPAIAGDQIAWWVMNDAGNVHTEQGNPDPTAPPLGVEVRAEAFAATRSDLYQVTFYRFAITNRGTQPIDSLYAGFWTDFDLGFAGDDYVGTDTTSGMVYVYNAVNNDPTYGTPPPASGVAVLAGGVGLPNGRDDDGDGTADEPGERLGLTAAPFISKTGTPDAAGEPTDATAYYRRLQGRFGRGQVMREFGHGWQQPTTVPETRFFMPGDPVTASFWSERNVDEAGTSLAPNDMRATGATGPFSLAPGATDTVAFAVTFALGTDHLDSVARLRTLTADVWSLYRAGGLIATPVSTTDGPPTAGALRLNAAAPNPASGTALVGYAMASSTALRAVVVDVLGRVVAVVHDGPAAAEGTLRVDTRGLPVGVYHLRVATGDRVAVTTLVVAR